jgi:hypothetical protein
MAMRRPTIEYLSRLPRVSSSLLIASFGLVLTAAVWLYLTRSQSAERVAEITRIHRDNSAMARAFALNGALVAEGILCRAGSG